RAAPLDTSLSPAAQLANVRSRIYTHAVPAVVVAESGGGTSVSEGAGASGNDTIAVRLSSQPAGDVTVNLDSSAVGLGPDRQLEFYVGGVKTSTLTFTPAGAGAWDAFQTVEVR